MQQLVLFVYSKSGGSNENSLSHGIHKRKEFKIADSWKFWKSEKLKKVFLRIPEYENISKSY